MNAEPTDPRDGRWKDKPTAYRVDFWRPLGSLKARPLHIGVPMAADEWMLTDVRDVAEAIEWADVNAGGRTYTMYAVYDRGSERGLVHLLGIDPTSGHIGRHEKEVARLFAEHGYSGEVNMLPVVAVDERVFVLAPQDLAALTAPDELIASLEECLAAPVRLIATSTER